MPSNNKLPPAIQWNQLILDSIRLADISLPLAARASAIVHTAMFDAWSVYDTAISTCTGTFIKMRENRAQSNANKQKAFSYAAYRTLTELFRTKLPAANQNIFRDLMHGLNFDPDDTFLEPTQPQGIGNLAAKMILEYRDGDGSNARGTLHYPAWSDYTGYNAEKSTGDFMLPQWGLVKAFALENNAQFRPPPPLRKNHPLWQEQVKEILTASASLTDEEKVMAEYWSRGDGNSLILHWNEIAHVAANGRGYLNDDCIRLFFALNNAMLDATIACWDCLRYFDAPRPVDLIHDLYRGKDIVAWAGPNSDAKTIKGEAWQSYLENRAIPGYVSPQSTVSRAAAIVLQRYTGSDQFKGFTVVERGASRIEKGLTPNRDIQFQWPTYSEVARQAGVSGVYGGVCFSKADTEGQHLGKAVGERVWEKSIFYFNE